MAEQPHKAGTATCGVVLTQAAGCWQPGTPGAGHTLQCLQPARQEGKDQPLGCAAPGLKASPALCPPGTPVFWILLALGTLLEVKSTAGLADTGALPPAPRVQSCREQPREAATSVGNSHCHGAAGGAGSSKPRKQQKSTGREATGKQEQGNNAPGWAEAGRLPARSRWSCRAGRGKRAPGLPRCLQALPTAWLGAASASSSSADGVSFGWSCAGAGEGAALSAMGQQLLALDAAGERRWWELEAGMGTLVPLPLAASSLHGQRQASFLGRVSASPPFNEHFCFPACCSCQPSPLPPILRCAHRFHTPPFKQGQCSMSEQYCSRKHRVGSPFQTATCISSPCTASSMLHLAPPHAPRGLFYLHWRCAPQWPKSPSPSRERCQSKSWAGTGLTPWSSSPLEASTSSQLAKMPPQDTRNCRDLHSISVATRSRAWQGRGKQKTYHED